MAQQLIFDWPVGVSLGPEDFFVAPSNAEAFGLLRDPARWPKGKLALIGPAGGGKSHLASVFARQSGARTLTAAEITGATLMDSAVVVEDVDRLPRAAEEPLFHLHNHLAAAGLPLLLTARAAPARWDIALPDLASRMQATTTARIGAPDDALVQALVMKHFADRQMMPSADVIAYLATRIERSHAAAARIVAEIDTAALAGRRRITIALCRDVLDNRTTSV